MGSSDAALAYVYPGKYQNNVITIWTVINVNLTTYTPHTLSVSISKYQKMFWNY